LTRHLAVPGRLFLRPNFTAHGIQKMTFLRAALCTALALPVPFIVPLAQAADVVPPLRVCADPGNMPLSNIRGEGFENKIAETLAASMGTYVQYFWRPSIERGLTRQTFDTNDCDVFMNLPAGYERTLTSVPIYRSTFVFVYRNDKGIKIDGLDAADLKSRRVGVFQHSAIREALHNHGIRDVFIHHISHDADLHPELQPVQQVRDVVAGNLDIVGVWGPFAGYLKVKEGAPIVVQPTNLMDDETPMEFEMAIGMRRTDQARKARIEIALEKEKDKIKQILVEYGVPLVKCEKCVVSGDLQSHGPYDLTLAQKRRAGRAQADALDTPADQKVDLARLDEWLAQSGNPQEELSNAVLSGDLVRVDYLLKKGAKLDGLDGQGLGALHHAAKDRKVAVVRELLARKANANLKDSDGWPVLAHAVLRDDPDLVRLLAAASADLELRNGRGLTPLALAIETRKSRAALALIEAGANVRATYGESRVTPLMLAAAMGLADVLQKIVERGANVNATNAQGLDALMVAAANNRSECVQMLLGAGASRDRRTADGKTALSIARDNDAGDVVKLLEATSPASAAVGLDAVPRGS
jgi:quinoprotein dehydrogenase-associated probable ABC transporter substrate-binding protein